MGGRKEVHQCVLVPHACPYTSRLGGGAEPASEGELIDEVSLDIGRTVSKEFGGDDRLVDSSCDADRGE